MDAMTIATLTPIIGAAITALALFVRSQVTAIVASHADTRTQLVANGTTITELRDVMLRIESRLDLVAQVRDAATPRGGTPLAPILDGIARAK